MMQKEISLADIRQTLGYTQQEMANQLGMSVKAYWIAEKSPKPKKVVLLAAKYLLEK